jgi:hypothetical protein
MQLKGRIREINLEHFNPHLQPTILTFSLWRKTKIAPISSGLDKNPQWLPIKTIRVHENQPITKGKWLQISRNNKRISNEYSEIEYWTERLKKYIWLC